MQDTNAVLSLSVTCVVLILDHTGAPVCLTHPHLLDQEGVFIYLCDIYIIIW